MSSGWPFRDAEEWRWVLAEELGHWVLRHPDIIGKANDAIPDGSPSHSPERCRFQRTIEVVEHEARVFAEALRGRPWPQEPVTLAQHAALHGPYDEFPRGCARLLNLLAVRAAEGSPEHERY